MNFDTQQDIFNCQAECHDAKSCSSECHQSKCRYAEWHGADILTISDVCQTLKSSGRRRRNPLGLGLKSVRNFTHSLCLSLYFTHTHTLTFCLLPLLSLNSPSFKEYKIKRSQLLKDNTSSLSLSLFSRRGKRKSMFCHTVVAILSLV
jgi:hypothetical protein